MKVFICILVLSSFLYCETLKISFSRSSSEPYVFIEKRQLIGGVLKELIDALAKESGLKVEYVLVSKRNQEKEITSGTIDGSCLVNEVDLEHPSSYLWSESLYVQENVLIVRKENVDDYVSLNSLYGLKVGTIASASYPALMPYFENQSITRVENKKLLNNINQLRFGVIDAVVDTKLAVEYFIEKKELNSKLVLSKFIVDKENLHCVFRKDKHESMEKINRAIVRLNENGKIDKILNKYRTSF